MRITINGIALRSIVCIVISFNGTSAQKIKGVFGHPLSETRGELVWFIEGANEAEIRHDDDSRDYYFYVATENIGQCTAVKFDSLHPPLLIKSVKAFVYEYDIFPDLTGDALSPFYLSVYDNQDDHPGNIISNQVLANATGVWSDGGEWVEAGIEYMLTDKNIFWAQFSWLDNTPSAPVLGLDLSSSSGKSIIGYYDNEMNWQYWNTGNIMIRASVQENDLMGGLRLDSNCQMPDSFRVYSDNHPNVISSEEFYVLSIKDSLHCGVDLIDIDNYYIVTAFYDTLESVPSEPVYIEGTEPIEADVVFDPEKIDIAMTAEDDTSQTVIISNSNGFDLQFRIHEIEGENPESPYPISIAAIPASGVLSGVNADTIRIQLSTGQLAVGEYNLSMNIEFWDNVRQYRDRQFKIILNIDQATLVYDEETGCSDKKIGLFQNYPNPFNSSTVIPYSIPDGRGDVVLEIYNLLGKKIYSAGLDAGADGCYFWDGRDANGKAISSGIYLYRLRGLANNAAKRLIYLK